MKKNRSYLFQEKKKKKRRILSIVLIVIGALFSLSAITWIGLNNWDVEKSYKRIALAIESASEPDDAHNLEEEVATNDEGQELSDEEAPEEVTREEAVQYIEGQELPDEPTYVNGILIANKKYPLPSTFAPGESEEAREAFSQMAAAALLEDFNLVAFSTYRSFEYQTDLYKRYVERDGVEEADRYSARPGYSEHQTGLAFDIGEVGQEEHWVSSSFGETEAGKWLAENAHLYGFIMRYPEGKEFVTGYMHESWHFRYVGEAIAKDIYENKGTLEEYLDL